MNRTMGILISICLIFCVQDVTAAGALKRYVLVIGSNNGGTDRVSLRYAVSDAEHFVEVLEIMGGVDSADRILLVEPDLQAFHQALDDIGQKVQAVPSGTGRTEVILYYSGHADENGLMLGEERLSYRNLRDEMDAIKADVHIMVLDACASGAMTRLKGGQRQKAFQIDESSDMKGYALLTSSSEDESAQESDGIQASFFTHYLVSGLRGAADVSGDGKVTLGEAYQFAFHETLVRTVETQAGAQHPAYDINLVGVGDVVMTDIRQTSAGLILSETLGGHFYIRDEEQHLVAEVYKASGRRMELGLEPGIYTVQYQQDPGFFDTSLTLGEDDRVVLNQTDFQPSDQEQTTLRGTNTPMNSDDDYRLSTALIIDRQKQPFRGLQFSLIGNTANTTTGTQIALGGNSGKADITGFQLAIGYNYAKGDVGYGQYSQIFNWSKGRVTGAQLTTIFNVSREIKGVQGSSVANVADQVYGVQATSVVNIAKYVKGVQLGIINISDDIDGVPIGLFNYSKTGLFDVSTWVDETGLNLVTLRSGSRNFYVSYSAGYDPTGTNHPYAFGLGAGLHKNLGRAQVGMDATTFFVKDQLKTSSPDNLLTRIRIPLGLRLSSSISIFAGPSFNILYTDNDPILISPVGNYHHEVDNKNYVWPGFFAGIRIGRFGL